MRKPCSGVTSPAIEPPPLLLRLALLHTGRHTAIHDPVDSPDRNATVSELGRGFGARFIGGAWRVGRTSPSSVAQKQSARPITGRPRSITVRKDQKTHRRCRGGGSGVSSLVSPVNGSEPLHVGGYGFLAGWCSQSARLSEAQKGFVRSELQRPRFQAGATESRPVGGSRLASFLRSGLNPHRPPIHEHNR